MGVGVSAGAFCTGGTGPAHDFKIVENVRKLSYSTKRFNGFNSTVY